LSVYDYLKRVDHDIIDSELELSDLEANNETLSMMLFRKLGAYAIDLNEELGFTHLKPVLKKKVNKEL
jgi:hypothetical protein